MPSTWPVFRRLLRPRTCVGAALLGVVCGGYGLAILRSSHTTAEVVAPCRPIASPSGEAPAQRGPHEQARRSSPAALALACNRRADQVRAALGDGAVVVVVAPWVIVGGGSAQERPGAVEDLVLPFCAAVQREYALAAPARPATICLPADEVEYRSWSELLAGCPPPSSAGFFERDRRVIVVSPARRDAALRHELTHALFSEAAAHLPLWLAEGIAALHEAGSLDPRTGRFLPDSGCRAAPVVAALHNGALPPLMQLWEESYAEGNAELFYAHARSWCLFLHAEGSLRSTLQFAAAGPSGLAIDAWRRHALLGSRAPDAAEADFRRWLRRLPAAEGLGFPR